MKLPRMLDGSFREESRLHPSSLQVTLQLTPPCTATMTLPEGEPAARMRQWVELYGPDDKSLGIYRVVSVSTTYGDEQRVQLEHGISSMDDTLVVLGKDSKGVEIREISGSMRTILQTIINQQTTELWQLGAVEVPENKTYTVAAGQTGALQAMADAVRQVSGYALSFDQTTTPWTVSLLAMPEIVACECRMRRNMDGVTISYDDSDLCTRAYAGALPNGYMDADTIGTWGIVSKQLSMDDATAASDAENYAADYLEKHKNPTLTVEVDALRLAEITGEALDAFRLGTMCRVALPEWGVTVEERIVSMTYSDMLSAPESVRLTLSNPGRDTSTRLAAVQQEVRRSGGRSAGGIAKAMAYISEVEGELTLIDQRIALIAVDVNSAAIRLNGAEASIQIHGVALDDLGNRVSSAEIALDGVNATIALKAEKTVVDALGKRVSSAEIAIDGANAAIELKVSKDEVVSAINMTTEEVTISASKINLSGYVTATNLNAVKAEIENLRTGKTKADLILATTVNTGGLMLAGHKCKWLSLKDGSGTLHWYLTHE